MGTDTEPVSAGDALGIVLSNSRCLEGMRAQRREDCPSPPSQFLVKPGLGPRSPNHQTRLPASKTEAQETQSPRRKGHPPLVCDAPSPGNT